MESLTYGDVRFDVLSSNERKAETVYSDDGTQSVAIRQTVDVNCVYNPLAMSFIPGKPPACKGASFQASRGMF